MRVSARIPTFRAETAPNHLLKGLGSMLSKKVRSTALPAALAALALLGTHAIPETGIASSIMGGSNIVTVETSRIGSSTTLGGTVVPFKEVAFSAQMPGRVVHIAGREGDWFKKGKVLVALDNDDLLAMRRSARAALEQARANYRNAHVQYTRQVFDPNGQARDMGMGMPRAMEDMMPMNWMTNKGNEGLGYRARIYERGTHIDQARFGLDQARAKLQELDAKLRDTRSIAPFSGVIVAKHIEIGDTVQPGMPLLSFADTRHLQIKVDIPARLMPGIKKGMIIPAKLDVGDARVDTRVAQIYPMADPQRHTVTVKLDIAKDAPGGPGMYAEVMVPDITTPVKDLPTIPRDAVIWRGSLPAVLVAVENGKEPELRMIRLGGFVDDRLVSVLSGLQAGERILATPPRGMATGWKENNSMGNR